jgi:protein-S-isoprenylcysteine O-methyltransferase Ste14
VTGTLESALARATFAVMVLGWVGFSLAFAVRRRGPRAPATRRDALSLLGIALQMAGYGVTWSAQRLPMTRPILGHGVAVQVLWLLVTAAAAGWSAWATMGAMRALGRQWSLQARLIEGHELITAGPFRRVRHPIYSAMLAMLLASGVAMAEAWALAAGLAISLAGTWLRIRGEERLLREAFGGRYAEYAARVPALVPRLGRG